jgi:hypothetical protein
LITSKKNDDLNNYIFSDSNVFYYCGGYQFLPVFYYLRSINKNIILMTTSRSIYDYAKSIKIPVYFFKPIKLDLDIKNPLNCIRYLFELYKFKKRVQSFFNKYEGGKLFHNVESVDICFLYLLKKCKENNKLRSFKFKDQNDSNKTLKISLKNIYFIVYAWIFSKIYKLDLKARIINGEPLIHNTRDYSEISFNDIDYLVDDFKIKSHSINNKIVFILGHSFKVDSHYFDSSSLRELFSFLHENYSNILYKLHPGHSDYFSSMKNCSFTRSINYFEPNNLPVENINFNNCVVLTLVSAGVMNLKSSSNMRSFYLIDLLKKSNEWDPKQYKSRLEIGYGDSSFIKTYKELALEINSFFEVDDG